MPHGGRSSLARQAVAEHGDDVALHLVGAAAEGEHRRDAVEPLHATVQLARSAPPGAAGR